MSVLRNLEAKLGGIVEGRVRPRLQDERAAGRAGPQARQGDGGEPDGLRLARLRAEPLPRVPVARATASSSRATSRRCARSCPTTCSSTRARSASRSPAARRSSSTPTSGSSSASSASRPSCSAAGGGRASWPRPAPSAGRLRAHDGLLARPRGAPARAGADRRQALLVGEGRRNVLSGERVDDRPQPRVRRGRLATRTCRAATSSCAAASAAGRRSTSGRPTA